MLELAKLNGMTNRKDMDRFTRMLLSMGLSQRTSAPSMTSSLSVVPSTRRRA